MDFKGINFPVYRKYKNNKSYFKIIAPNLFEEIQLIGNKKIVKQIEAISDDEYEMLKLN